jgi:hypothetical protein
MSDNNTTSTTTTSSIDAAFADVSPSAGTPWDDTPPASEAKSEPKEKATEPKKEVTEDKTKEPTKKEKRWLEAKINGKTEKVDEETLLREYQKYKAADQKFQEASKAQQSVQQFMKALEENPEAVLNNPNLPLDRKKLAEKWLYEEIQKELNQSDPRDVKAQELEQELAKYKQKEQEEVEAQKEQEYQQVVNKRKEELGNMFSEAMSKSTLSKNPETAAATLREMALYYRAVKEQTGEAPTVEELASHVEQKYFKGMYNLADSLDGEELVKFLGDQVVKKIRKYDLSRLTKSKEQVPTPYSEQPNNDNDWTEVTKKTSKKAENLNDAKDRINKMLLGK